MIGTGIGALAQGLVQGYKVGDDLQTAATKRDYIEQETALNKERTAALQENLAREKKINAVKDDLAQSVAGLIPGPDGRYSGGITDPEQIAQRATDYGNKLMSYMALVDPAKAETLRRERKGEAFADQSRQVAQVTAGLLSGNPGSITDAAKLYANHKDGFDIDPGQSKFLPDGKLRLAVVDSKTGKWVRNDDLSKEDIVTRAIGAVSNMHDFVTMTDQRARTAETGRHNVSEEGIQSERNRIQAAQVGEMAADRRQRESNRQEDKVTDRWAREAANNYKYLENILKPEYEDLKSPTNMMEPEKKATAIRQLDKLAAFSQQAINLNHDARQRVSAAELVDVGKTLFTNPTALQFAPVIGQDGNPVPGIGRLPSGAFIPLPSGFKLKPVQ